MLPFIVLCLVLSIFRIILTKNTHHLFLVSNLLLAMIPFFISMQFPKLKGYLLILVAVIWVLFLPNAFYVITDLIHLNPDKVLQEGLTGARNTYDGVDSISIIYDTVLIFSYSAISFVFGLESMRHFKDFVLSKYRLRIKLALLSLIYFACGFAIYLGRYSRFYSWDLIAKPFTLISESLNMFIHPSNSYLGWQVILIFTALVGVSDFVWSGFKAKKELVK